MNNEIGRKLTSLTLMTLMLAGGMVIGVPSMVPEAAAAGKLYVSAENAQFGNSFGGGSIVEVIVRDTSDVSSATDKDAPEPTVFVDNQRLRMAQGADGYWYAFSFWYFVSIFCSFFTENCFSFHSCFGWIFC